MGLKSSDVLTMKPITKDSSTSAVLHRHLNHDFLSLVRGEGSHLILEDGRRIFDASGGAAVACLGHSESRVIEAVQKQMKEISYCATIFYTTGICERLCQELVESTHGHMSRAYIVNSGLYPADTYSEDEVSDSRKDPRQWRRR
jgi:adenosylmethionine-8-amino-7-oxononanoate aminotransferase